MAEIAGSGT